jgi:type I restriction enzyme S subunit
VSWNPTRLASLTEVITKGTTPTTLGYDFVESGIPFLRVQNIDGGRVNYERDTLFIDSKTHEALSRSQIHPGDILVTIAGTIGRAGVVPDGAPPLNCNQAVAVVRTTEAVFRPFLRLWIESLNAQRQMQNSTVTGTISNISLSQLGNLKIPLPPLAVQRRIADVLERAEALRAKRQAALAKLDSLTQSLFLGLFGNPTTNRERWPTCTLGDVLLTIRNGVNAEQRTEPSGWPITRIETIADGTIDVERVRWIEPDESLVEDFQLKPGDILFSHINSVEHIGKTALFSGAPTPLIHGVNLLRLRPKTDVVDPVWLLHLLKNDAVRNFYRTRCKRAVNQASLNQPDIKSLAISLPPLTLQQDFARRVRVVERLEVANRASLAGMDSLFAALQYQAFNGEL